MRRRLLGLFGLGLVLMFALLAGWSRGYAAPDAPPAAAPRVALPAIDVGGDWTTQLSVQNLGSQPTYAVLDLYAVGSECAATAPVQQLCLGAVGPSQAKLITVSGVPAGSYSAFVTSYTDCYGGAPAATPLAVVVARQHNLGGQPARIAASAYTGQITDYSAFNSTTQRYTYYAPHIRANLAVSGTSLNLQNLGSACASVRVQFFDEGFADNQGCNGVAGTVGVSIAPGSSQRLTPDQASLPVFFGNALIESTQPLALAVDVTATNNRQMLTYTGLSYAAGGQRLAFPFIVNQSPSVSPAPWLAALKVQNPNVLDNTLITERLVSRDGAPGSPSVSQNVCPGSSRLLEVTDFGSTPDFLGSANVDGGAAIALLSNGALDQFEGYSGIPFSEGAARLGLPRLRRVTVNDVVTLRSQVMVRNLDAANGVDVSLALYDEDAKLIDTETEYVEASGSVSFDLAGLIYLGNGWRGSGIVTASSANARLAAVVLERGAEAGSDTSRAYVAARVATLAPTPTPTRTAVPTSSPTPTGTLTPVITPTPTSPPTNTPTPQPTVVAVTPVPNAAGYVVSANPNTNFLTSGEIYVGSDMRPLKPLTWIGAVQFDVSAVPDTATILDAALVLTGKNAVYLDGAQGVQWSVQLLDPSVDAGWTTIGYFGLSQAEVADQLTPTMTRDQLGVEVVNTFTFTPAGRAALEQRLKTTNKVSLRITASQPNPGYRAIFTWYSGNVLAERAKAPVLRLTYR